MKALSPFGSMFTVRNSIKFSGSIAILVGLSQIGAITTVAADAAESTIVQSHDAVSRIRLPHGPAPTPWIAAHRGQWRDNPENSIPGILDAIKDGADMVEIDISSTKDGQLVLMHDKTVDRTTNGTGNVADMTFEEIKKLRLRQNQGNGPAPVTEYQVPTFKEVLAAVKGKNVLLNLDKGWQHRDQLLKEILEEDMLQYALFKGSPTVEEAVAFMKANPDAYYMHVINDKEADHFDKFVEAGVMPDVFEIAWDSDSDPQGADDFWNKVDGKAAIYANSMWNSVGGGHTDEASLIDPATGWGYHVARGADIIQTDNVKSIYAWRSGEDITKYGLKEGSIRVQAENYVNDPAWFKDDNEKNDCKVPVAHPGNPIDACNLDGAQIIQYIRDEFWALDFEIPKDGEYELTMRQSADTEPGGTVTVETGDGQRRMVATPNTTHNRHFTVISLGKYDLKKGTNRIKFTFTHPDYMSVDWVQADLVVPTTTTVTAPAPAPVTTTVVAPAPAPNTTVVTTTVAAPTVQQDNSSRAGSSAGLFIGGTFLGAFAVVLALIAGLGGPINTAADQIRAMLPM